MLRPILIAVLFLSLPAWAFAQYGTPGVWDRTMGPPQFGAYANAQFGGGQFGAQFGANQFAAPSYSCNGGSAGAYMQAAPQQFVAPPQYDFAPPRPRVTWRPVITFDYYEPNGNGYHGPNPGSYEMTPPNTPGVIAQGGGPNPKCVYYNGRLYCTKD